MTATTSAPPRWLRRLVGFWEKLRASVMGHKVHPISREFTEIQSHRYHHEGTDDYTNDGRSILKIVSRDGQQLDPLWSDAWTEVAPGVATRHAHDTQQVRIHAGACPVRVLFRNYREYVSYSDQEFCSSSSSEEWVTYVSDGASFGRDASSTS